MKGGLKAAGFLDAISAGGELGRHLEEAGVSVSTMVRLLKAEGGRRAIAERRALMRLQSELMARRYGAAAVAELCRLLGEKERPELRMKGAMAVLEVAGLVGKGRGGRKREKGAAEKGESGEEIETEEMREIMGAVSEVMAERRRRAAMGGEERAEC